MCIGGERPCSDIIFFFSPCVDRVDRPGELISGELGAESADGSRGSCGSCGSCGSESIAAHYCRSLLPLTGVEPLNLDRGTVQGVRNTAHTKRPSMLPSRFVPRAKTKTPEDQVGMCFAELKRNGVREIEWTTIHLVRALLPLASLPFLKMAPTTVIRDVVCIPEPFI